MLLFLLLTPPPPDTPHPLQTAAAVCMQHRLPASTFWLTPKLEACRRGDLNPTWHSKWINGAFWGSIHKCRGRYFHPPSLSAETLQRLSQLQSFCPMLAVSSSALLFAAAASSVLLQLQQSKANPCFQGDHLLSAPQQWQQPENGTGNYSVGAGTPVTNSTTKVLHLQGG